MLYLTLTRYRMENSELDMSDSKRITYATHKYKSGQPSLKGSNPNQTIDPFHESKAIYHSLNPRSNIVHI